MQFQRLPQQSRFLAETGADTESVAAHFFFTWCFRSVNAALLGGSKSRVVRYTLSPCLTLCCDSWTVAVEQCFALRARGNATACCTGTILYTGGMWDIVLNVTSASLSSLPLRLNPRCCTSVCRVMSIAQTPQVFRDCVWTITHNEKLMDVFLELQLDVQVEKRTRSTTLLPSRTRRSALHERQVGGPNLQLCVRLSVRLVCSPKCSLQLRQ